MTEQEVKTNEQQIGELLSAHMDDEPLEQFRRLLRDLEDSLRNRGWHHTAQTLREIDINIV